MNGRFPFSIHQLFAEAIDDKETRTEAVKRLQDNLKRAKTVVNTLEFAARVNHEIGLGSEERVGGVTIIFQSNLQPGALGRLKLSHRGAMMPGAGAHARP